MPDSTFRAVELDGVKIDDTLCPFLGTRSLGVFPSWLSSESEASAYAYIRTRIHSSTHDAGSASARRSASSPLLTSVRGASPQICTKIYPIQIGLQPTDFYCSTVVGPLWLRIIR